MEVLHTSVSEIALLKLLNISPSAPIVASRSVEFTVVVPSESAIVFASIFVSMYVVPADRPVTLISESEAVVVVFIARPTLAVPPLYAVESDPVSKLRPLKVVRLAMLSISFFSVSISSPIEMRSLLEAVLLPA